MFSEIFKANCFSVEVFGERRILKPSETVSLRVFSFKKIIIASHFNLIFKENFFLEIWPNLLSEVIEKFLNNQTT